MTITVSSGTRLAFLSTLITFCVTALSTTAVAQNQPIRISDAECTTLFNDSTLNEQNVTKRIACHQLSVERIDWLVKQLQSERSILTSKIREDDPQLLEYKQKLIDNQKVVVRLEQRTTDLANLSDALRVQRDEYRERLFTLIQESEANDQSRQLDDRIFRNFSESYVSLSNENTELRRMLNEHKQNLLSNQSDLDKQQTAIQQLQGNLSSSAEQLAAANQFRLQTAKDQRQQDAQLESTRQELRKASNNEKKQLEENGQLKRELALLNEEQQKTLEKHQESNKTRAQEINRLQSQLQARNEENRTLNQAISNERANLEMVTQDAKVVETNLLAENSRLEKQLEQSIAQLAQSEQQQTELMQQMDDSNARLVQSGTDNRELQLQIEKVEERNTRLHDELDDREKQLTESQRQQQSLQEELRLVAVKNEELNTTLQTQEQNFGSFKLESDNTLDRFKAEVLRTQLAIKRLEKENSEIKDNANQLISEADEQNATLSAALTKKDEELSATVNQQTALNQQNETTIGELKDRLITRDQRIFELRKQQNLINKQLLDQTASSSAEVESLKEIVNSDKQSIEQLTAQAGKLEEELNTALDKLDSESQARSAAEKLRAEVEKNSEENLQRLKMKSAEDAESISKLENQLAQVDSRYQEASSKLSQLNNVQKENESLSSQLSATREQLTEQIANNELLESRLSENSTMIASVKSNLTQAESNTKTIELALQAKVEELNAKQAQFDRLKSSLSASEEEKDKLAKQVTLLENDLSNLNELLQQSQDSVAASLEQMREELRASDKRLAERKSALAALIDEKRANDEALKQRENESFSLTESIKNRLITAGLTNAQVKLQSDQTIAISVGSSTLFRPGSSQLTEEGSGVLATVGNSISDVENRKIVVEGHSDDTPLGAKLEKRFVDNWGLSMARAVSTANFLSRNSGIAARRLSVSGLGDTDPVADNATAEGRQQNRRVEILLIGG